MGVSREDVKKACIDAVENANVFDVCGSVEKMHKAIDVTGAYFSNMVNPVHKAELPYIIAVLEATLHHLKSIDKNAAEAAESLREAFDFKCGHISIGVLEEAMRAMNGECGDEKE